MKITCEICPHSVVAQLDEANMSADPIVQDAHKLAQRLLILGSTGEPGPTIGQEVIDPQTGYPIGPKIMCCNPNATAASMVLGATFNACKRRRENQTSEL